MKRFKDIFFNSSTHLPESCAPGLRSTDIRQADGDRLYRCAFAGSQSHFKGDELD